MAVLLAVLSLAAVQVFAVAIGANRASIQFTDVLRDGFARSSVVITTDSEEPISGELVLEGGERDWLNFSAMSFNFSRESPYELIVEARPPRDARIETYRINMSILTGELGRSGGGLLGTATRASLGVPIFIGMTGTERLSCTVGGVRVLDAERGRPIQVQLAVTNTGNVRVNPEIEFEVFDKLQADSLGSRTARFGEEVLPTITSDRFVSFALDLDRSQHWAAVRVPECGYEGLFSFDVLDVGEIKDDGELIRIDVLAWSETGDIVPVSGVFRNRGARSVRAVFKGTITSIEDDEIVKVFESDSYIVDPGVTADLETFFNPQDPGQYMVVGKVFYNEKLTSEKSAVLNVNGAPIGGESWLPSVKLALLVMMVIVIILLLLIIRKRRRRSY